MLANCVVVRCVCVDALVVGIVWHVWTCHLLCIWVNLSDCYCSRFASVIHMFEQASEHKCIRLCFVCNALKISLMRLQMEHTATERAFVWTNVERKPREKITIIIASNNSNETHRVKCKRVCVRVWFEMRNSANDCTIFSFIHSVGRSFVVIIIVVFNNNFSTSFSPSICIIFIYIFCT